MKKPNSLHLLRRLLTAVLLVATFGGGLAQDSAAREVGLADPPPAELRAGQKLSVALDALRDQGLDIFFTSHLVKPRMEVARDILSGSPRARLDELLAPHGLHAITGPGGRLVIVDGAPAPTWVRGLVRVRGGLEPIPGAEIIVERGGYTVRSDPQGRFELSLPPGRHRLEARLPGFVVGHFEVELLAGEATERELELEPAPMALDAIIVTPSRISLLRDDPIAALDFDRREIFSLPHFGDDIFRALTLLPGVTGEESSARFNIRGSRADEVLVLLDHVELFEPYHLKDFGSPISIIPPRTLREVNLITGGFPVQYGDRMSGVLEMSSEQPERNRTLLGVGLLNTEIGTSGIFGGGRGQWLGSARRSHLDLALDLLDIREQPKYWGGLGKVDYSVGPRHRLTAQFLYTDDSLDFSNLDPGDQRENFLTSYNNTYAWAKHQWILGSDLFAETTVSHGLVERDRRGAEDELATGDEGLFFSLFDRRELRVLSLKQDWSYQATPSHYLRFGFETRRIDTFFDYMNARELDDPLEDIRFEPRTGTRRFLQSLRGDQLSAYWSDRWRASEQLVLEFGVRYDEQDLTDDKDVSPRFNLVWALSEKSTLRAAWGYFYQSQRPYELQVEDGITTLAAAERTEQRVLGFEHAFNVGRSASEILLRVEAYQRLIDNPRRRYENIFEPNSVFPEIEPDRILFVPEGGEAHGLELYLRGSVGSVDWWASYANARVFDVINGADVPRRFDQPHSITLDVNFPFGEWSTNLAWRYHTGWPTTRISAAIEENDEGELEAVPVFGPFNAERLRSYHRLDLRLSREWQKRRGTLGFFLEIQNLYNRRNQAGFDPDFDLELTDEGEIQLDLVSEVWGGLLPSFGFTWEF